MSETLCAALASCLSRAKSAEVEVVSVTALSGGAASESYAVDAKIGSDGQRFVLQRSLGEGELARTMSRATQARLQLAVEAAGVPVPPIVHILEPLDNLGEGFIMTFIDGETLAPRYLRDPRYDAARQAMTGQAAHALAATHAIDRDTLPTLQRLDAPAQLAALRDTYDEVGGNVPIFEIAFHHLGARLTPAEVPVLVHGDFRSGNLIVDTEGLRAVLDWELAHIGDPRLDIGWLSTNTWRFGNWEKPVGGFGDRQAFLAAYAQAGGARFTPEEILPFEMLGSLRWGVMCLQMAAAHLDGSAASVERAAIGRRVSETEADLLYMLRYGPL